MAEDIDITRLKTACAEISTFAAQNGEIPTRFSISIPPHLFDAIASDKKTFAMVIGGVPVLAAQYRPGNG